MMIVLTGNSANIWSSAQPQFKSFYMEKNNYRVDNQSPQRKAIDLDLSLSTNSSDNNSALLTDQDIRPFQSFVPNYKKQQTQTDFSLKMPSVDRLNQECQTAGCHLKQTMEAANDVLSPNALIQNPPGLQLKVIY